MRSIGFILVFVLGLTLSYAYPDRRSRGWRYRAKNNKVGTVDATSGGTAQGEDTEVKTGAAAEGRRGGRYNARSRGSARATGRGKTRGDLESFAFAGRTGGLAASTGDSEGEVSSVDGKTIVNVGEGGSWSYSRGSTSASGRDLSKTKLETFANLGENQGEGWASSHAAGNQATGSAGANAVNASGDSVRAGAGSAASSVTTDGKGGAKSRAGARSNTAEVDTGSQAVGEAETVVSGSQSNAAVNNNKAGGSTRSFANAKGKGSSFASSGASVKRGGR